MCLDGHYNEVAELHEEITKLKRQLSEEEVKDTTDKGAKVG
jgi:hypothetical protein